MATILMPMAGLGSRFQAVGETRPKPLIPVLGRPMFSLAMNAVRLAIPGSPAVAVVLRRHDEEFGIAAQLAAAGPDIRVAIVPELTGGALQTCLAAQHLIDPEKPIVVLDCDLTFSAPAWAAAIASARHHGQSIDGALLSFRSREPRYSYAEEIDGRVVRTAEKVPISDRALIGAYGFAAAGRFFDIAADIVARNERTGNGEFYVSSAFNALIRDGGRVQLFDADRFWSMGTPEELAACLQDLAFADHVARLTNPPPAASSAQPSSRRPK